MTTLISLLLLAALGTLITTATVGIAIALLRPVRDVVPATAVGGGSSAGDARDVRLPAVAGRIGPVVAFALLATALLLRTIAVGHAPWSNLHEVSIAFAAMLLGVHLVLAQAHPIAGLAPIVAIGGALLVGLALSMDDRIDPLVPALQQPILLTVHVGSAVLAYAISGVAFAAALAELLQRGGSSRIGVLPSPAVARSVSHRTVLLAFPILTLAIVLGSIWANLAWRSYWSNDPKELAAAATWLVFGAYLHVAGRRDRWQRLAPWLIVAGFAGVLFTYIGAGLFFVGEHSYAAP